MDERFFRQLSRALAPSGTPAELTPVGVPAELVPAGVLAVNYWGDRGPGLKQAWCRLRLVFDSGEGRDIVFDLGWRVRVIQVRGGWGEGAHACWLAWGVF